MFEIVGKQVSFTGSNKKFSLCHSVTVNFINWKSRSPCYSAYKLENLEPIYQFSHFSSEN